MQLHSLYSVLLLSGSFSILNLVVKNILKSVDLNKTLSFNSSLVNFSDPTLLKGYMETLTLTASVTFMTGIIQVEDESVISLLMCPYVYLCTNVRSETACVFLQVPSSVHLNTYVVQNGT